MLPEVDTLSRATRPQESEEASSTTKGHGCKPLPPWSWQQYKPPWSWQQYKYSRIHQGARSSFPLVLAMLGVVGTRMLPRRHRQAIARVTVSALVATLPLLYVSLLRPPPAALAGDTAFWFLMSNCVIAAIVATADDAGTLFFGPSKDEEACNDDAVVPLAADELTMERRGVQEEAVDSNPMDLVASPFLIPAESGDAANVSAQLRGVRHETAIEQSTDQNNTAVMVKGHEGEEIPASPTAAPDESIVTVGKLAITKADRALTAEPEAEPEPWVVPKLLTSKSLPDQEVQEEDASDDEWLVALDSRPPDVLAHGKGGRLRRSVTDGSKSVAEEESEYWQLSDEELNRRVEDFIARFNRQMRLQIEQEAGV